MIMDELSLNEPIDGIKRMKQWTETILGIIFLFLIFAWACLVMC